MKEQVKVFWNDHKEDIKTGALLVITPIAVLGLIATKSLSQLIDLATLTSSSSKGIKK